MLADTISISKIDNDMCGTLDIAKTIMKPKVSNTTFIIPSYLEYEHIRKYNYTLSQLKIIAKHYKQKLSGNKPVLLDRLYNFLKMSVHAIRIQSRYRGYLQRKSNGLRGPGFLKRDLCTNATDFYTLDDLTNVSHNQFYSFKDDNFVYGFDIASLYHLVLKNGNSSVNPYNRTILPKYIIKDIRHLIRINKLLNISIDAYIPNNNEILTAKQRINQRINAVFQDMDALGNYTNSEWFTNLTTSNMIIYIRELFDIWSYRAQLSQETKNGICPPNGTPFRGTDMQNIINMSHGSLRQFTLSTMENLIRSGTNTENRTLGAYYVLAALTLVSNDAATSMPWLYQSVAHY